MQSGLSFISIPPLKGCDNMPDKVLYLAVEISQMFKNIQCTYSEAERILNILTDDFKQQREELEYDTFQYYKHFRSQM